MKNQKNDLGLLALNLKKILNTVPGRIVTLPLDFVVFNNIDGVFTEREDRKFLRPLNIFVSKRTLKYIHYSVGSSMNKYRIEVFSSGSDWEISGGKITEDNLQGAHYLRLKMSNFSDGSEARLYSGLIDSVQSTDAASYFL